MTFFDAEYFVLASRQQREREAEQYRLTHPRGSARSGRASRRRHTWPHLPDLSALLHPHRHTPRILG
jgi:hypothetical protein